MSTYKLYYFNARGSAEPIRIIFAQAGVEYRDYRMEREQWAKEYKESKMTFILFDGEFKSMRFRRDAIWTRTGPGSWRDADSRRYQHPQIFRNKIW